MADLQAQLDALAETLQVPHALVMRKEDDSLVADLSGGAEKAVIAQGSKYKCGPKPMYCETVINSNKPLIVNDANASDEWKGNPDAEEFGLVSYAGVPVHGADGNPVGTVCVVDKKVRKFGDQEIEMLASLRDAVEATIKSA